MTEFILNHSEPDSRGRRRGGAHMWERAAAISAFGVPAAGASVLTRASIGTNQRCAQAQKSKSQDGHVQQSLNPGDRSVRSRLSRGSKGRNTEKSPR